MSVSRPRVGHLLARRRLQPLYDLLDRVVLAGRNVGIGGGTEFSGERRALGALAKGFRPAATILDVGANVGDYAADVLANTGPGAVIHCFEPSVSAYATLSQRYSANPQV